MKKEIICKCCKKTVNHNDVCLSSFCTLQCYSVFYKVKEYSRSLLSTATRVSKCTGKKSMRIGFLYMFKCEYTKRLKIGFMKDLNRIHAYNTHLPIRVEPVVCNGSILNERAFVWTAKELIIEKLKKKYPKKTPMEIWQDFENLTNGEWIDYGSNPEVLELATKFMANSTFREKVSKKAWNKAK